MPGASKTKKELLDEIKNLRGLVDSLRQAEHNNICMIKALKGSEYSYRAVVEDQTELICRFLPDCTLTFVNDAYCRYFGKSRGARGLSRGDANELVMKLLDKYEADIPTQPIGQTFEEVYDLKTVRLTPEWQGIYDEVREELIGMGLPLDSLI